jgi:hypothetical protein
VTETCEIFSELSQNRQKSARVEDYTTVYIRTNSKSPSLDAKFKSRIPEKLANAPQITVQ